MAAKAVMVAKWGKWASGGQPLFTGMSHLIKGPAGKCKKAGLI